MKTVITSAGKDKEALFDLRFGRCPYICIVDKSSDTFDFLKNPYSERGEGAGTGLAEEILKMNIQRVISGDFGAKAQKFLQEHNIQMIVIPDNNKTVGEIIQTLDSKR